MSQAASAVPSCCQLPVSLAPSPDPKTSLVTPNPWQPILLRALLWGTPAIVVSMTMMFWPSLVWPQPDTYWGLMALMVAVMWETRLLTQRFIQRLHPSRWDMFTLIGFGIWISAIASVLNLGHSLHHHHFMGEATVMISVLVVLGQWIEAEVKAKTARQILSPLAALETSVLTYDESSKTWISQSPRMLQVGQRIQIPSQGTCPLDVKQLSAEGVWHLANLTGESAPRQAQVGDLIEAGSVNTGGVIEAEVVVDFAGSRFYQLQAQLEQVQAQTVTATQTMVDHISRLFIPLVFVIALLSFFTAPQGDGLNRLLSVLLIACPCALGLATPVALSVTLGIATNYGLQLQSIPGFLALGKVKTIAFDKTGTLTALQADFTEHPRPDAKALIVALQQMKLEIVLLTGDHPSRAEALAQQLGIATVYAGCRGDDKAKHIQHLQAQRQTVAMVGDGVNDALALQVADVGVSFRQADSMAQAQADILLSEEDLMGLLRGLRLSQAVQRIIAQNIALAFVYNLIAIPAAAGWLGGIQISPPIAALAMSFSSLAVLFNSQRLRHLKLF